MQHGGADVMATGQWRSTYSTLKAGTLCQSPRFPSLPSLPGAVSGETLPQM